MPESLFCSIRQQRVASLPEEKVRQTLLQTMTEELGYPKGNLAVEKSLDQLPHLHMHASLPKRRADVIVFGKDIVAEYPLYPLLLIECKAVPLTQNVLRQVIGYNHFVGAFFIAVVNQTSTYLGCYDPSVQDYRFVPKMMHYQDLVRWAKDHRR